MDALTPRAVDKVSSLIGASFRANVGFPQDDEQLAGFDIELVSGRKGWPLEGVAEARLELSQR